MAESPDLTLAELRQQIDALDAHILSLLNTRATCAQRVAEVKLAEQPDITTFYRPEREAQVLRRIMALNPGPLSDETVARLFREIMSACLALEKPIEVAFLGPLGTFTHAAALKHFGQSVLARPLATIDEVFREVEAGTVPYGVVPVENSSEGVVNYTLDRFVDSPLQIIGEVELRIHHHLLAPETTAATAISRIYSHQQSLAQCRQWLDANYPKAERVAVSSNAEAARRVQGEWHSAAIAGETAATLYGLKTLSACIEDHPDNTTRFLIIGREAVPASGSDKTSLMISVKNTAGALYHVLEPFHRRGINLTRIESRPSRGDVWTYVFFIDLEGHQNDPLIQAALTELEPQLRRLKGLGSYPRAVL